MGPVAATTIGIDRDKKRVPILLPRRKSIVRPGKTVEAEHTSGPGNNLVHYCNRKAQSNQYRLAATIYRLL